MEIKSLASSSNGNCYLISDGSSSLLIECGINVKKIINHVDLTKVKGCLISHEHRDHSVAFKDILKYTYVYASKGTLDALNEKYKIPEYDLFYQGVLEAGNKIRIGSFQVVSFSTEHDAKEPLGFLIYSTVTNEKLLFATDTYFIRNKFVGLNYIMIECNYSKDTINPDLSKGERMRLLQSHFELENVKTFLKVNDLSKCHRIYLMHLSSRNSDAQRFKKEIQETTGVLTEVFSE